MATSGLFPQSSVTIARGNTVRWTTTFYDVNNNVVQPDSATINILYSAVGPPIQDNQTASVPLSPQGDGTWTAIWDSRNALATRTIYWSIHTGTDDPPPVAVEDGSFLLSANPANLPTF